MFLDHKIRLCYCFFHSYSFLTINVIEPDAIRAIYVPQITFYFGNLYMCCYFKRQWHDAYFLSKNTKNSAYTVQWYGDDEK